MKLSQGRLGASLPTLNVQCGIFGETQNVSFCRVILQALALLAYLFGKFGQACIWHPKLDRPQSRSTHPLTVSRYL
jgi:hypothetical protein